MTSGCGREWWGLPLDAAGAQASGEELGAEAAQLGPHVGHGEAVAQAGPVAAGVGGADRELGRAAAADAVVGADGEPS